MKSFKNRLGEDGTFRDFCRWYGGDCGNCFKRENGLPDCYEVYIEEKRNLTSRSSGAAGAYAHFSPDTMPTKVCKMKRGQWHLCNDADLDRHGTCVYARVTGHCMKMP